MINSKRRQIRNFYHVDSIISMEDHDFHQYNKKTIEISLTLDQKIEKIKGLTELEGSYKKQILNALIRKKENEIENNISDQQNEGNFVNINHENHEYNENEFQYEQQNEYYYYNNNTNFYDENNNYDSRIKDNSISDYDYDLNNYDFDFQNDN